MRDFLRVRKNKAQNNVYLLCLKLKSIQRKQTFNYKVN